MKISAIIVALHAAEFIQPCIKAFYPFVDRIKIQTNYDRPWSRKELISIDKTVEKILQIPDKEGKISLHIYRMPDDTIARNWLMRSDGYILNHRYCSTVSSKSDIKNFCEGSDYFWIIDADEIYDSETIPNILDYLVTNKPRILKIRGVNYFKSWNYRISPSDYFYQPGFIKCGIMLGIMRDVLPPFWFQFIRNKYWNLGKMSEFIIATAQKLSSVEYLPEKLGVFHHGAYVGDDRRIYSKIHFSPHCNKIMNKWYENVWKKWTPKSQNLHPVQPEVFKGVEYIPTRQLPRTIKNEEWPCGYIER